MAFGISVVGDFWATTRVHFIAGRALHANEVFRCSSASVVPQLLLDAQLRLPDLVVATRKKKVRKGH